MLNLQDFTNIFETYTDSSDLQLGVTILKDNNNILFYSKKITETQQWYTTVERKIPSIVRVLKENENILPDQLIIVYT